MSEAEKSERLTIEILPIFGETPAPTEPCERSFDDPPLREDDKSFCVIGTLDDLYVHLRHYFRHGATKQRALIAAIGVEFHQERIHAEHGRQDECAAVPDPECQRHERWHESTGLAYRREYAASCP